MARVGVYISLYSIFKGGKPTLRDLPWGAAAVVPCMAAWGEYFYVGWHRGPLWGAAASVTRIGVFDGFDEYSWRGGLWTLGTTPVGPCGRPRDVVGWF